jgi:hypothetical protein
MGFYSPQTLVADARRHGVEVRRPDISRSGAHATLEVIDGHDPGPTGDDACLALRQPPVPNADGNGVDVFGLYDFTGHRRDGNHAMRLGLAGVTSIGEKLAEEIVTGRDTGGPFTGMADLARRIEGRLSAIGVTVLFTRSATTGPDDLSRAMMANQAGADIMLSLHCDSTDQLRASGVATFFWGLERFGAWSAVGEQLANLIQREIVARTSLPDCRSHARAWVLLQRTQMPTVRIEAGYLSHPEDAARLADPSFLDTLAEAIVIALQRMYLGEDDTNATGVLRLGDLRAYNTKQRASQD